MEYIRTGWYENDIGRIEFKATGPLYLSTIDTTGVSVDDDSEELAGSAGAAAGSLRTRSRVIPATFTLEDLGRIDKDHLLAVLSPLMYGTLTIRGEKDEYKIDCRPEEMATFSRNQNVPYLWSFSVDFHADYPFWRRGLERSITAHAGESTVYFQSKTIPGTPCIVEVPEGVNGRVVVNNRGFTVIGQHPDLIINSRTATVKDRQGNSQNSAILSFATEPINKLFVNYGRNSILFSLSGASGGDEEITVRWYEEAWGVI